MKKGILILAMMTMAACSSFNPKPEELQAAPTCKVWKEGALGMTYVNDVEGEMAHQKMTCWLWNSVLCSYTDYTFKSGDSGDVVSSLPPADKPIAHLDSGKMHIFMTGATSDPFTLNNGKAQFMVQGPIGPKQTKSFEYNKSCTQRQAALGIMALMGSN